MRLDLTTFVVREYDEAIAFFTEVLGFGAVTWQDFTSEQHRGR